jgi:hypothetical protein
VLNAQIRLNDLLLAGISVVQVAAARVQVSFFF